MELTQKIAQIVEEQLLDKTLFVVSVHVKVGSISKVEILIDGDHGVGIDDCASISRRVGNEIEEQKLFEKSYHLEISSPGVGQPLKMLRQYKANVGRGLKVILQNGKELNGKLKEVSEAQFLIENEVKEKNKKKVKLVPEWIAYNEVNSAKVTVSFK